MGEPARREWIRPALVVLAIVVAIWTFTRIIADPTTLGETPDLRTTQAFGDRTFSGSFCDYEGDACRLALYDHFERDSAAEPGVGCIAVNEYKEVRDVYGELSGFSSDPVKVTHCGQFHSRSSTGWISALWPFTVHDYDDPGQWTFYVEGGGIYPISGNGPFS